jgi:O-antigen/teichoic acid export membrane protein/O-antigen ligase
MNRNGRRHGDAALGDRVLALHGLMNIGGGLVGGACNFAAVVLLTRSYGLAATGLFFQAFAVASIMTGVSLFGAPVAIMRFTARHAARDRAHVRSMLSAAFVPPLSVSFVVAIALVIFAEPLASALASASGAPALASLIKALAFMIPATALTRLCAGLARGLRSSTLGVILDTGGQPLFRVIGVLTLAHYSAPLWALGTAWTVLAVVCAVVALWWARRNLMGAFGAVGLSSPRAAMREFWAFTAPRGLEEVAQLAGSWILLLLVGALAGAQAAGVYTAVSRSALLGTLILQGAIFALGPSIAHCFAIGDRNRAARLYQISTAAIVAVAAPVFVAFLCFPRSFLLLFAHQAQTGALAFRVLVAAMLINVAAGPVGAVLLMAGRSSWNLVNAITGLALALAVALVTVPIYGALGAACAWGTAIVVQNLLALTQINRHLRMHPFSRALAIVCVLGVVVLGGFGAVALVAAGDGWRVAVAALVLSAATYWGVLYRLRFLSGLIESRAARQTTDDITSEPVHASIGGLPGGAYDRRAVGGGAQPKREKTRYGAVRARLFRTGDAGAVLITLVVGTCLGAEAAIHPRLACALAVTCGWLVVAAILPEPRAVSALLTVVVLAPDTVTLTSFGNFSITLRITALIGLSAAVVIATARGKLVPVFPHRTAWILFAGAAVVGTVTADRPRSIIQFALLVVAPFFVGTTLGRSRTTRDAAVNGLIAGALVLSVVALAEFVMNRDFAIGAVDASRFMRVGHVRANAGWSYPVAFGAFMCLSGFFVVEKLSRKFSRGLLLSLGLIGSAVFVTQSRAAVAGVLVGALIFALSRRSVRRTGAVLVACGLIVALFTVLPMRQAQAFREFAGNSGTAGTTANANVAYRKNIYDVSLNAVRRRPLVGYGYGSTQSIARNDLSAFFGSDTDIASLPLSVLVQVGVVGFLGFYGLIISVAAGLWRDRSGMWNPAALAGVIGSGVAFVAIVGTSVVAMLLLVLGLFACGSDHNEDSDPDISEPPNEPVSLTPRSSRYVASPRLRTCPGRQW